MSCDRVIFTIAIVPNHQLWILEDFEDKNLASVLFCTQKKGMHSQRKSNHAWDHLLNPIEEGSAKASKPF